MLNHLEATIQKLISEGASKMAQEIAHSIRETIAAEIVGAAPASAPAPKRRGRPPGSTSKVAAAAAAAPGTAKAPAAKAARPGRRGSKRKLITQAELDVVLRAIGKKAGMTSVEIQKAAGIDAKQAGRVLNKLRVTKAVTWKGERSKATYTAA